jgi:hypothetical protein
MLKGGTWSIGPLALSSSHIMWFLYDLARDLSHTFVVHRYKQYNLVIIVRASDSLRTHCFHSRTLVAPVHDCLTGPIQRLSTTRSF